MIEITILVELAGQNDEDRARSIALIWRDLEEHFKKSKKLTPEETVILCESIGVGKKKFLRWIRRFPTSHKIQLQNEEVARREGQSVQHRRLLRHSEEDGPERQLHYRMSHGHSFFLSLEFSATTSLG